MLGILGTVLCLGVGMCLLGKMCWRPAKLAFVLLTVLGVASVLGGLGVFGSHRNSVFVQHSRWIDSHTQVVDDELVGRDVFKSPAREIRERWGIDDFKVEAERHVSKGAMIALGALLVIAGWLLVTRERTQPFALRALTVLGLAAGAVVLASFFASPPHSMRRGQDRIVRDVAVGPREAPVIVVRDDDQPVQAKRAKTPKRSRAKRPVSRADRSETSEELLSQMPPRAGEIPVDRELAKLPESPQVPAAPSSDVAARSEPTEPPTADAPPVAEAPATPSAEPAAPQPPAAAASAPDPPAPAETKEPAPATPVPPDSPSVVPTPPTAAAPELAPGVEAAPAATVPHPGPAATPDPPATQKRPTWLDTPGTLDNTIYRIAVKSELYASVPECQRALDGVIKAEADHYINEYLGDGAASLVDMPRKYLRDHVKKDEFSELVQSPTVGPMHQIHALLEFDDDARAEFHSRWRNAVVTHRLWYAGSAAALFMGLLATLFGYLKLDLKTGGAQKGRLQLAATLVALIVAAGALLLRWAVPF